MENQQSFTAVFYHFGHYTDTDKPTETTWEVCSAGNYQKDNQ